MNKPVFASTLQNLRKENKITQEQLASALGVSAQAVSKWENGSFPEGDLIPRLADFFNVSIDYLYGRDNSSKSFEQMVLDNLLAKCEEDQKTDWCSHKGYRDQVMNLIWASQISTWVNNKEYYPRPYINGDVRTCSAVYDNLSYSYMGHNLDEEFFLFLKTPESDEGFASWFKDTDRIRLLFKILSDEDNVRIFAYMYSLTGGEYVTKETVSKALNIKLSKVEEFIDTVSSNLCPKQREKSPIKEVEIVGSDGKNSKAYGVDVTLGGLLLGMFALASNYTNPPDGYSLQVASRSVSWIKR